MYLDVVEIALRWTKLAWNILTLYDSLSDADLKARTENSDK